MSPTTSISSFPSESAGVSFANTIPTDILLSLQEPGNQLGDEGLIVLLPNESEVQAKFPPLWFLEQAGLNPGAYYHPVLILEQEDEIVFAAPITSFREHTLHEKYADASKEVWERVSQKYIAIRRKETETVDINTIGQLEHSGRDLVKQSYVNLDNGFWMPRHCLETLRGGERKLTPASLKTAQRAYGRAESHRHVNGLSPRVPEARAALQLPSPPPSPPAMGRQGSWQLPASACRPFSLPTASTSTGHKRQRSESPVKMNKARMMNGPSWR